MAILKAAALLHRGSLRFDGMVKLDVARYNA